MMSTCDVCGGSTTWEEGTGYSPDEFRRLVAMGFAPVERMGAQLALMLALTGRSTAEYLDQWRDGLVAQSTTDWLLCPACAGLAGQYLPKPAGRGRSGAPLREPFTPAMFRPELASSQLSTLLNQHIRPTADNPPVGRRFLGWACGLLGAAVFFGLFLMVLPRRGRPIPPATAVAAKEQEEVRGPVSLKHGHSIRRAGEKLVLPVGTRIVETAAGRIAYPDRLLLIPAGKTEWEYEIRPSGAAPLKIKLNGDVLAGELGLLTTKGEFLLTADLTADDPRIVWIAQTAEVVDRSGRSVSFVSGPARVEHAASEMPPADSYSTERVEHTTSGVDGVAAVPRWESIPGGRGYDTGGSVYQAPGTVEWEWEYVTSP